MPLGRSLKICGTIHLSRSSERKDVIFCDSEVQLTITSDTDPTKYSQQSTFDAELEHTQQSTIDVELEHTQQSTIDADPEHTQQSTIGVEPEHTQQSTIDAEP